MPLQRNDSQRRPGGWTPVTSEIENLRGYLAELVTSLVKSQQEQFDLMRQGDHPFQSSRAKLVKSDSAKELNQVVESLKSMLQDENAQVKSKLALQDQKIRLMQQHNDKLQVDNAKLRQAAHGYQSDIVQLQQKQLETETEVRKQEIKKTQKLRLKNQELEERLMKLKVGQSSTRKADRETAEMAE